MNSAGFVLKKNLRQYMMLIVLAVIVILFNTLTKGVLLKPMNISNLINQNAYVIILAAGMLQCILTGGNIDLSVGSVLCLVGACLGIFIMKWGWNSYLAIFAALGIGILIGMWQGFWIAYVNIPPFICTLAGMLLWKGLALLALNSQTISNFPADFLRLSTGFLHFGIADKQMILLVSALLGALLAALYTLSQLISRAKKRRAGYQAEGLLYLIAKCAVISAALIWFFVKLGQYRGVPVVLITVGIVLLVYTFFTSMTVPGRYLYAIGGNAKAARLSGVNTRRMMFYAYTNMAFLAAVAAVVFCARMNSAGPQAGEGFEMDAIASCFIGGASAYGGTGTVSGSLIGALIMGVLNNGMSIMGINQNMQKVVKGLVLLAAVAFDVSSKKQFQIPLLTKVFRRAQS
ncbi:MAG: multiple monosaccharide ABC transporter permease [Christensenellales bacterium]|jgi:putative multiple sugar transport system permease protein